MAQYDATSLDAALKEYYDRGTVQDTVYEDNPWFGMIEKKQVGGKYFDFPVQYTLGGGRSHDISKSLANKKVGKFVEFNVPTVEDYNAISIGRKVMKQTSKDEYAFFEAQQRSVDKMLKELVRSLAQGLFRNAGGSRGVVGSVSGTDLTLDDVEEVANFEVGDEIAASDADGTGSSDSLRSGTATITAINRDTGVLTTDVNWATQISGLVATDYLFKDGDFSESVSGFADWCPDSAPSSGESFFGADRSADATRLAGVRVSAVGDPITEAILKGCSRLGREGAMPDTVLMGHAKFRDLCIELGNKATYEMTKATGEATVGFQGVKFMSNNGSVTCYADHNCPNKKLYITKKSAWKLIYNGDDVPELFDDDGLLQREASSDGYEVRAGYYANGCCMEPNNNAVVTLEN